MENSAPYTNPNPLIKKEIFKIGSTLSALNKTVGLKSVGPEPDEWEGIVVKECGLRIGSGETSPFLLFVKHSKEHEVKVYMMKWFKVMWFYLLNLFGFFFFSHAFFFFLN